MSAQPDFLKQQPPPLPARPIKLPTAYETILPNGLAVIVVEDSRLPLISYRLAFRTGDAHDPPQLPGLMDMLTGLLTEGTRVADQSRDCRRDCAAGCYAPVRGKFGLHNRRRLVAYKLWRSGARASG